MGICGQCIVVVEHVSTHLAMYLRADRTPRQVFGKEAVLNYSPQNVEKGSVAASFKSCRTDNRAEQGADA
jgi:hypothetical protein